MQLKKKRKKKVVIKNLRGKHLWIVIDDIPEDCRNVYVIHCVCNAYLAVSVIHVPIFYSLQSPINTTPFSLFHPFHILNSQFYNPNFALLVSSFSSRFVSDFSPFLSVSHHNLISFNLLVHSDLISYSCSDFSIFDIALICIG